MSEAVLLDNVTHKNLKVNKAFAPGQGFDVNVVRVFPVELRNLACEYAVFFTRDAEQNRFEPVALLGLQAGQNLYLRDGSWDARYQPLNIQRQPLMIGFQEQVQDDGQTSEVPVAFVDMAHPSVNEEQGEPLFLPHGGEAPLLERTASVLQAIHEGHGEIEVLSRLLVGMELIESATLEYEDAGGERHSLTGLYTINEDRLRSLQGGALEVLHRDGHLEHIYMILASHGNLGALMARQQATAAS